MQGADHGRSMQDAVRMGIHPVATGIAHICKWRGGTDISQPTV